MPEQFDHLLPDGVARHPHPKVARVLEAVAKEGEAQHSDPGIGAFSAFLEDAGDPVAEIVPER